MQAGVRSPVASPGDAETDAARAHLSAAAGAACAAWKH